ncbi:hypothetical protein SteCoe_29446 [Stentor coeruleus]|uniref:Uncharacterized protein n=1 Tax=Stentor coeruleus TaxID=5963 RepID=A0A1R2B5Y8_9CILI|nr:hypothetical protein SteCoe_29446 [Stentor coeruleus]
MGTECSCFRYDYGAGSVEISEKAVVVPLTYEPGESRSEENSELKSLCRGYLARKSLKELSDPGNYYELCSLPINSFQSSQIALTEENLLPINIEVTGPVYLIDQEYYQGSFNKRCMKHGKGILISTDNRKYIGNFHLDRIEGFGRMIFENGDVYEGEFLNGQAHGKGKYIQKNGAVYSGEFKKDKQHGIGTELWCNGCKYEGSYKKGMKHGKGKITYPNNTSYTGDFYENRIEGKGVYQWSKAKWYEGEFVDNKMHGQGELHSQSGLIYKGSFVDDFKDGYGILTWPDGRIYEGMWKNGVQHGEGIFTSVNKLGILETRKGQWSNGKRETWLDESL